MRIRKLIIFGFLVLAGLFLGWIILWSAINNYEESKFHDVEIPKHLNFEKPVEYLTNQQIDSLKKINIHQEKIIVTGSGYGGYDFYMWHKSTEKGAIYIKAFELTQNIQLSEWKLSNRTQNRVSELSTEYKLYKGYTVIDEGTFDSFYPVRFELWFKDESSGIEKKLAEKKYIIDGWDR